MANVTVVLPAYNEEAQIAQVIGEFQNQLSAHGHKSRYIVVDDGSQDGTVSLLKDLQKTYALEIFENRCNRGIGVAVGEGLHRAILDSEPDDIIVTAESDRAQDGALIISLVNAVVSGADLAVATPLWYEGFVGVPWYREWLSRGGNLIYRTLFPIPGLHDYTNLYRGFRAGILKQTLAAYGTEELFDREGFEAVPDLLIKMRPFCPKIEEIPVTIDYTMKAGPSSMGVMKTIAGSLSLCAKHLFNP